MAQRPHTISSFDELEFQVHKRKLYKLYNWDPNMNLTIDPEREFLDETKDFEWCDDPFHCCHEDYYNILGQEWSYIEKPNSIFMESKLSDDEWSDGTTIDPIIPPMRIRDTFHYFQPNPGMLMSHLLERVGTAWDPNLPSVTFKLESSGPVTADITTEDQGVPVMTQNNPTSAPLDAMAVAATGKTVDSEWETFFSFHQNVNWTTSAPQGNILYVQALNPIINPYLKHLAELYVAWSGSIDVRFTVSGSGVYGGKLAAIVIPPGIQPIESTSMLQYPHVLFDARQSEPVIFTIPDIRDKLYHQISDTDTTKLVIMVYNELINPYESTGKTSGCSITVETRPNLDFKFSLLKPPGTILTHGRIPNDLIPRHSRNWAGNRCWSEIDGFIVRPRVFQANRHFNFKQETSGWSTPYYKPIEIVTLDNSPNLVHKVFPAKTLIEGIPDGWPDTTVGGRQTLTNGDYNVVNETGNEIQSKKDFDEATTITNNTPFKGMYICGALQRRWGDQKRSETGYITTANSEAETITPTKYISKDTCILYQDTHNNRTEKLEASTDVLFVLGYTGIEEDVIGLDEDRVVRVHNLPEAYTNGGNYPVFFKNQLKLGYVLKTIDVANSQILTTSRNLAENNYELPEDSLAVYRITDSDQQWFDLGINHDGFSFVGTSKIPALTFPLTAAFVGIQLAKVKLASNLKANVTKI